MRVWDCFLYSQPKAKRTAKPTGFKLNNKMKKYTKEQLIKKYQNKFIDIYGEFDYKKQIWFFEVRSVKSEIWENHNLPEEATKGYN